MGVSLRTPVATRGLRPRLHAFARAGLGLIAFALLAIPQTAFAQTVSQERLNSLDPSRPAEYKRYAEELAEKGSDPAARETALRLFHTAAWLDPDRLAEGSLKSMIAIARSPEEEQRFRAALFLLDPAAEASSLARPIGETPTGDKPPPPELLQALRQLRHGLRDAARRSFALPPVREYLAGDANRSLREELQAMLAATELRDAQLRRILELDIAWSRPATSTSSAGDLYRGETARWTDRPPARVTLRNLTEFDPNK